MISPDMKLVDVIAFLEPRTAVLIDHEDGDLVMVTLVAVRNYLNHLESQPPVDPITLGRKLHEFTDAFILAYKGERRA